MGEAIDKTMQPSIPQALEELEEELLKGLRNGEPITMGPSEWQQLHEDLETECEQGRQTS